MPYMLPLPLSATNARRLADDIESAVAQIRLRIKTECYPPGPDYLDKRHEADVDALLDREVGLVLSRVLVRYGFDFVAPHGLDVALTRAESAHDAVEAERLSLAVKVATLEAAAARDRIARDALSQTFVAPATETTHRYEVTTGEVDTLGSVVVPIAPAPPLPIHVAPPPGPGSKFADDDDDDRPYDLETFPRRG